MKLVLNCQNPAEMGFAEWLKSFKDVNTSLLIEVDVQNECFVAKTHTPEKTVVKFGTIPFSTAGFEVQELLGARNKKLETEEWVSENPDARIKLGISLQLAKFIEVVDLFAGANEFTAEIEFPEAKGDPNTDLVAQKIQFKSSALVMTVAGSVLSEFVYISDAQFKNAIAKINNAMKFELNRDVRLSLQKISSIYSSDAKKDVIEFYTKEEDGNWVLYAYDRNNHSYDFKLGYLNEDCTGSEVRVPVSRNNFITATKCDNTQSSIITIPGDANDGKIKLDNSDGFETIIASIRV